MSVTVCVCVMRSVLRYVALLFVAVRSVVYQGGWCTCGGVYQVALLLLPYYLSIYIKLFSKDILEPYFRRPLKPPPKY